MDDRNRLVTLLSGVATPEKATGIAMKLPRGGCLTIFTLREAIIPLVQLELGFSTSHNMI